MTDLTQLTEIEEETGVGAMDLSAAEILFDGVDIPSDRITQEEPRPGYISNILSGIKDLGGKFRG